jgi:hypothetical protein
MKMKNLKSDDKVFLFINIEIVELFKFFIENPDEPFLEVHQGEVVIKAICIIIIIIIIIIILMVLMMLMMKKKIEIWGGIWKVLEELLEGLVA